VLLFSKKDDILDDVSYIGGGEVVFVLLGF
jgi:hypothetical protein